MEKVESKKRIDNTKLLLELPILVLKLPARMTNKLASMGVDTVAEALSYFDNIGLPVKGVGKSTIEQSMKSTRKFIDDNKYIRFREIDDLKDSRYLIIDHTSDLCENIDQIAYAVIDKVFFKGKVRNTDIINKRFGLANNNKYTLEEIGDYYDLTRERVRQVEAKIIRIIRNIFTENTNKKIKSSIVLQDVYRSISFDIENTGNIVSEQSIINIIEEKHKFNCSDKNKLELFLEVIGYEKLSESSNSPYLKVKPLYYRKTKITAKNVAKIIHNIGVYTKKPGEHSLFDIVVSLKRKKIKNINKANIALILNNSECITSLENDKFKTNINCLTSAADKAYSVLLEATKPLHFSEIAKRINKHEAIYSDDAINSRNLTNQMAPDKRFVPVGKSGRWGLTEWKTVPNISSKDLMIKVLHKAAKPMSAREIHAEVIKTRKHIPLNSVSTYLITHKDIFVRVSKGVYGLRTWDVKEYSGNSKRIKKMRLSNATKDLFKLEQSYRFSEAVRKLSNATGLSEVGIRQRLRASEHFSFSKADTGRGLIIKCINKDFHKIHKASDKKTLREQIQDEIRTVLYTNPNKEYLKGNLYSIIKEQVDCIRPTFYSYLSEMKDLKTIKRGASIYVVYIHEVQSDGISVDIPDNISTDLSANLSRAISKLTIDEIDIGLFELGKIFETELKSYLVYAKKNSIITVSKADMVSFVKMIQCVVREKIITKGYYLHILREDRNARAHDGIPSKSQRKELLDKAHYLVDKYLEYIVFFHEKRT